MALPIGGFMPIPLALMIPFMATQSLVMGEAFGIAFQYGKRRISAMSNEDFNKLTIEEVASQMFKSYENIIPELKQSIKKSTQFQNFIFATLLDMPRGLLAELFGVGEKTDSQTQQEEFDKLVESKGTPKPGKGKVGNVPPAQEDDPNKFLPKPKPKMQVINKNNPTWKKAIKLFTDAIVNALKSQALNQKGFDTQLKQQGKKWLTSSQANAIRANITKFRIRAISLSQQLNQFRLKYPSSGSNYP